MYAHPIKLTKRTTLLLVMELFPSRPKKRSSVTVAVRYSPNTAQGYWSVTQRASIQ